MIVGENDGYSGLGGLFGMTLSSLTYPEALDEYDAFGSVGRGRIIQPRYRFTVTKEKRWIWPVTWTEYAVTAVQFQCAIEDLYDFNYEDGDLPSHAAAMQVGFGNGDYGLSREHGRIYRHRINILHTYGDHPFDIHR